MRFLAGFLAGAALAVMLVAVLTVGVGFSGIAMRWVDRPVPPWMGFVSPTPADGGPDSPLGVLPAVAVMVPALGVAGAGLALIDRRRWRRAGAPHTRIDLDPGSHLPETAALWLGVAGLMALVVWALAGPELAAFAVPMLVFFVVPILAAAFKAWFSGIYAWMLPRVCPLDAAAYAGPVIQREAARQILADQESYGRNAYHRSPAARRHQWAHEVLAAERTGAGGRARRSSADGSPRPSQRRTGIPPRRHPHQTARTAFYDPSYLQESERLDLTARRRAVPRSDADLDDRSPGLWRWPHLLLAAGTTIAVWRLVHWVAWQSQSVADYLPSGPGATADVVGLLLGLVLGVGPTWLYIRYVEGP